MSVNDPVTTARGSNTNPISSLALIKSVSARCYAISQREREIRFARPLFALTISGDSIVKKLIALLIGALVLPSLLLGQVPNKPTATEKEAAAAPAPEPSPTSPNGVHEMSAADVESFLDGLVPLQLKQSDIAGATIAVVKDGKVLFAKGYGYADVQKKQVVSPQETLFRPGSISKLFTWTAIMQLFEQGKLDLDRDVNDYLDFKIPEAFGKPITLKNIMTHTPGFEEQIKDIFALDGASPELGKYLAGHMPARIFPPGRVPAYSN